MWDRGWGVRVGGVVRQCWMTPPARGVRVGGGWGGLAMIDERVHTLLTRRSSDSLRPVEDYVFHSGDVFTTDLAPPPLAATIFRL